MKASLAIDKASLRQFNAALRAIKEETKKDGAESLNRACRNVAFKAAEFTPKADPAKIEAELRKDKLGLKIVTKRLRARVGVSFQTSKGARTVRRVTRKQIALRTRQLFAKRKKARGFLRAGWFAAILHLGGTLRGASRAGERKPDLRWGGAKKATAGSLLAAVVNRVWDRLKGKAYGTSQAKMVGALNLAIRAVAFENEAYLKRKIEARLRQHSHR